MLRVATSGRLLQPCTRFRFSESKLAGQNLAHRAALSSLVTHSPTRPLVAAACVTALWTIPGPCSQESAPDSGVRRRREMVVQNFLLVHFSQNFEACSLIIIGARL